MVLFNEFLGEYCPHRGRIRSVFNWSCYTIRLIRLLLKDLSPANRLMSIGRLQTFAFVM